MDSPEALVAGLVPIELAEVQARVALAERLDRKYIVDWSSLSALVAALSETHAVLEIDGHRAFHYVTDYFDSAELACYHAHVQHRRRRFKARIREYTDSGYRRTEVKLRGRRGVTVKHWTDEEADLETFARATIAREYRQEVGDLVQTIRVCFQRITLVNRGAAERITIDFDLRFEGEPHWQAELLPDYAIVETKAEAGLARADLVLRRLRVRPVSISKYVTGMGLLSEHVPNELRPLVRRHFRCQTVEPAKDA